MRRKAYHTKSPSHLSLTLFGWVLLFAFFSISTQAQNTKGDQTSRQSRETRFKSKKPKKGKGIFSKRVGPKGRSQASRASQSPKLYPQKGRFVNNPSTKPKDSQQRWRAASTSRVKVRSATGRTRNVYPQTGRFVNNPSTKPKDSQQRWRAASTSRVKVRSATGRTRNVYPQTGRYVNNPSREPKKVQKTYSNRADIARNEKSGSQQEPSRKKRRVKPASASRAYMARKSINPYAGFWNKKRKGERAYIGDISGRRLRTKNYETPKTRVIKPSTSPYYGRKKRVGDRPYKGPAAGGYVSATRSGRAWKGDITGRKIRGRNFSSKGKVEAGSPIHPPRKSREHFGDRPYKGTVPGGGYRTATQSAEKRTGKGPIPGKAPGIGANKIDTYQGNIRFRKTFSTAGADYSGNIKARKPLKGGGSVSGKLWNNRQTPLPVRTPKQEVGLFPGKHRLFDSKPSMRDQGEAYTGHLKARRPEKGGGSVSGKLWNNKEQPIPGKEPLDQKSAGQAASYQGNVRVDKKEPSKEADGFFPKKYKSLKPQMRDQGEEFTGYVRLSRFKKDYIKNPNQNEEALKKAKPDKTTYKVNGLQVRVKEQTYKKKPNAADGSMPGIAAGKNSIRASEYAKGLKIDWDYKRNPSSADDALKVRVTGKAFGRSNNYQGNVKMKKFQFFGKKELHPDAQFVKLNKNNVKEEKGVVTNFKLWWARLFKKNDAQPDHLKEKVRKPRYDKGEQGLWYD